MVLHMDIDTAIDQLRAKGYRVTFADLDQHGYSQYTVTNPAGNVIGVTYGKTIAQLVPQGFYDQAHIREC